MKILITGATGFIGRTLVPYLVGHGGHDIALVVRNGSKARDLFPDSQLTIIDSTVAGWQQDVAAYDPDVVFHLAALNTSRNDSEVIRPLVESNITFGIELLQALSCCSRLKLFVNTGSFAEYRLGCGKTDNAYLYSATKTAFRAFLDYYAELCRYKYVTAIPYSVYGGFTTVKRIMDYMMDAVDAPVDMTPGEQLLDFIHVDDIASFYYHVIRHFETFLSLPQGEEFHLGTGIGTSLRQIAGMIEKLGPCKLHIRWGGRPYRERDTMYAVASIAKNIELIGWKASISLETGIKMFLENYGANR